MDEFEEIDYEVIRKDKKLLERLTSDRYWNEYNGNWKNYLNDVFKYDDLPNSKPKPFTIKIKKIHPFSEWISDD
jgi:hypothetical protein